jgi:hypothetical protein
MAISVRNISMAAAKIMASMAKEMAKAKISEK